MSPLEAWAVIVGAILLTSGVAFVIVRKLTPMDDETKWWTPWKK